MIRRILVVAALALACAPGTGLRAAPRQSAYEPLIADAARKHGIPVDFLRAVIRAESNYDASAVSPKGAVGLMQLMPETAAEYGVKDVYDPVQNLEGGCLYLKDLIRLYKSNRDKVLAAYNAGQEAVRKYNGIPPYRETINYIARIKAAYDRPTISTRTRIFKVVDASGRVVLTNDPLMAASAVR